MGTGQGLQLAGDGLVPAQGELRIDPRLGSREEQFLQATRLRPGEGFVTHLAVGRSAPQAFGLGQHPHALARLPTGQLRHVPSATRRSSTEGVGDLGGDLEHVAGRPRHDHILGHPGLAQALAQAGDRRAQRDLRPGPFVVAPQGIDQAVHRDDDVAIDEEPGHQRPRLDAPDVDDMPVPRDLDGPEHPYLQSPCLSPRHHAGSNSANMLPPLSPHSGDPARL